MALQVGLADFQIVHPTEMETYSVKRNINEFDVDKEGRVFQKTETISTQRRKRLPVAGAKVVVKPVNSSGKPTEIVFETDACGRALCGVMQDQLPLLPMEADFEVRFPGGKTEHGKVRCGGNEPISVVEVVLQNA